MSTPGYIIVINEAYSRDILQFRVPEEKMTLEDLHELRKGIENISMTWLDDYATRIWQYKDNSNSYEGDVAGVFLYFC